MASLISNIPQKRKAISDIDRQRICKRNKDYPRHQSMLIAWFCQETSYQLNQSSISKILSSKYDYLDDLNKKKDKTKLESKRTSAGDWPELEEALYEQQQRMQKQGAVITGEILKAQAAKFQEKLPQYEGIQQPKWSNSQLDSFKTCFKIKEFVQHREAGSAAVYDANAIKQMNKL